VSIRVGVLGASGRMGVAACRAVEAAGDLDLVAGLGSVDPLDRLAEARVEVVVDLTRPDAAGCATPRRPASWSPRTSRSARC